MTLKTSVRLREMARKPQDKARSPRFLARRDSVLAGVMEIRLWKCFREKKRVGWASGVQAETRRRKTQLCLPEAAGLFSLFMWNGEARLGGLSHSCVHFSSNFLPSTSRAPGTVLITRHITVHSDTRKHKCEFTFLSLKQWR